MCSSRRKNSRPLSDRQRNAEAQLWDLRRWRYALLRWTIQIRRPLGRYPNYVWHYLQTIRRHIRRCQSCMQLWRNGWPDGIMPINLDQNGARNIKVWHLLPRNGRIICLWRSDLRRGLCMVQPQEHFSNPVMITMLWSKTVYCGPWSTYLLNFQLISASFSPSI